MTNLNKCFQIEVSIYIIIFLTNRNNKSVVSVFKKKLNKKQFEMSEIIGQTKRTKMKFFKNN